MGCPGRRAPLRQTRGGWAPRTCLQVTIPISESLSSPTKMPHLSHGKSGDPVDLVCVVLYNPPRIRLCISLSAPSALQPQEMRGFFGLPGAPWGPKHTCEDCSFPCKTLWCDHKEQTQPLSLYKRCLYCVQKPQLRLPKLGI